LVQAAHRHQEWLEGLARPAVLPLQVLACHFRLAQAHLDWMPQLEQE
jgi:hypothetical protein